MQCPVVLGLSLCEQAIIEEKTRNVTLINCFTHRLADKFPSEPVPFVVFALLTDGTGEIPLEVAIERLDTLEEIYRVSLFGRFLNPLQTFRCMIRIRNCSFPVPGHYQVCLLAGNEVLGQRKIIVLQKENKQ